MEIRPNPKEHRVLFGVHFPDRGSLPIRVGGSVPLLQHVSSSQPRTQGLVRAWGSRHLLDRPP
jgi:hypothetical protein